jgi:hypothetical protein
VNFDLYGYHFRKEKNLMLRDQTLEEAWRAPPADVPYRARSSLTGLVAIAAR